MEKPQHEYEVTALILAARPDAVRRGHQVGEYLADAELLFGERVVYLERERSRKSLERVEKRIGKYKDCQGDVLWVLDTDARIKNVLRTCSPPKNHYFTTYDLAVHRWHDRNIWQQNT